MVCQNSSPPSKPVLCLLFSQLKLFSNPPLNTHAMFYCLCLYPFHPLPPYLCKRATQSSLFLRSTCPNHLNLPRRTTSNTHSIPNRPNNSSFVFLSFNVTPHIHLTIILSALSKNILIILGNIVQYSRLWSI